jgi:hypothetical protein
MPHLYRYDVSITTTLIIIIIDNDDTIYETSASRDDYVPGQRYQICLHLGWYKQWDE